MYSSRHGAQSRFRTSPAAGRARAGAISVSDLEAEPEADEHLPAVHVVDHPAEVLPEEAGDEREREEDRRDDRQLLRGHVEPVRGGGEVGVDRRVHQLAVAVDRLAEAHEMVVDVPEVALRLARHPGQLDPAADHAPDEVALRHDDPAQADEPALHLEDVLEVLAASARRTCAPRSGRGARRAAPGPGRSRRRGGRSPRRGAARPCGKRAGSRSKRSRSASSAGDSSRRTVTRKRSE